MACVTNGNRRFLGGLRRWVLAIFMSHVIESSNPMVKEKRVEKVLAVFHLRVEHVREGEDRDITHPYLRVSE